MPNSIRTRLTIVFLGLAVGPLLIFGLLIILNTYNVQTQGTIMLQHEMASRLSTRVQSLIRNLESELKMLIRLENLKDMEPDRQNLILSIFHSGQSAIDDLILLDADGQVLNYHSRLKLYQDSHMLLQLQNDFKLFTVPMTEGETYFGPVRFDEQTGEPLMIMIVPIINLNTGKLNGGLVADIRLKEIWDLIAKIHPGQKGSSYIVDAKNRIVAHRNPSVVLRGTHFDPSVFDGVQMGLSGKKSVLVSQVINFGDQKFHIIVEDPVSEALSLTIHSFIIMLIIVIIALLMAGSLGFLSVYLIVKPIEEIAKTARAINAGDLSRRVVVKNRDELGLLASAFNKMTLQLETLINDLEKRVAERTTELIASNHELEAFSYSISHDLRAPLRAINGFSHILLEEYINKIDEQGKNYFHRVLSETKRMEQLIDDMLNLSRITRNEIIIQDVDLSTIANDIAEDLRRLQPGRQVDFIIQPNMNVQGDGNLLRVMLENLFNNAWKYTSKHKSALIEFGMRKEKNKSVYFVRDDGAGFNMKYVQKLFGAFQRLHTIEEFPGTGIGLVTVQRIIKRHGGEIWAEGEIEKGAVIYFTIP